MSVPPPPAPIQDRANRAFLQETARLIGTIFAVKQITFWWLDSQDQTENNTNFDGCIQGFDSAGNPLTPAEQELYPRIIQGGLAQWQNGAIVWGNVPNTEEHCPCPPQWQTLSPSCVPQFLTNTKCWVVGGACHQTRYVGGIGLQLNPVIWQAVDQNRFQQILKQYASFFYGQQLSQPVIINETQATTNQANGTSLGQEHRALKPTSPALQSLDLSHIHHELRTPLTGILGFSRMLREELYGSLNPKQHQYVQGILNSAEYLLSLVNDVLDLSKIDAGCEELFWELVAVEDLCLAVLSMVQPRAKEQGLRLTLEMGVGVDLCRLDQRRWKQILINLLSNAIKFTEQGEIRLRVERRDHELWFAVIDTGIGIAPEDQQLLFQPFKQLHNPLNRQQKGSGLGLALSRKLAQLHGGDIRLQSVLGQGSCFEVFLPLKR